jgi:hypothetical protein
MAPFRTIVTGHISLFTDFCMCFSFPQIVLSCHIGFTHLRLLSLIVTSWPRCLLIHLLWPLIILLTMLTLALILHGDEMWRLPLVWTWERDLWLRV